MDSIREQIIQAWISRMSIIRTANGFNTDCGATVLRAGRYLDPDTLPAVISWPRKEENDPNYTISVLTMLMDVELYMLQQDGITPSESSEMMLADVIEAVMATQWAAPFTDGITEIAGGDILTGEISGATAIAQSVTVSSGSWAGGDAAGSVTLRRVNGTFVDESASTETESDVITLGGASIAGVGRNDLAGGGLVRELFYIGGGTDTYPDADNDTVGVQASFSVVYQTAAGDPYHHN